MLKKKDGFAKKIAFFTFKEKIGTIREYVAKILRWSKRYDLPPQVISDRILFRNTLRRRALDRQRSDEILNILLRAFNQKDRSIEQAIIKEYTKKGFFDGEGRFPKAARVS